MSVSKPLHITVEPVDAAAAPLFAAMHARAFDEPWPTRVFETMLNAPTSTGFLASHGDAGALAAPAGFALLQCAGGQGEVITLGVDPAARRCGAGRALVAALVAHAQKTGTIEIFLEVSAKNMAARALYTACGFEQVGVRKGYYGDGGDAITCRLVVPDVPQSCA